MNKTITESLWITFITLLAVGMIALWDKVSEAPQYAVEYIQPVDLALKEPEPLETVEFYRTAKIKLSKRDFNCLAKNIYYEAGVEDYAGKIAVAQITWNRVRHGRWGDSVCRVVYAKKQFSWTHQKKPAPSGKLWTLSLQAAEDFVNGTRHYELKDSKYYHATWIDAPAWTQNLEAVAIIGQHHFYKTPK